MSTAPGAASVSPGGDAAAVTRVSKATDMFKSCWSCRLLSGGGLMLSGAYVYMAARKTLRYGGPPSIGTVAQISFALCLASWGAVIIVDPVGKSHRADGKK